MKLVKSGFPPDVYPPLENGNDRPKKESALSSSIIAKIRPFRTIDFFYFLCYNGPFREIWIIVPEKPSKKELQCPKLFCILYLRFYSSLQA